MLLALSRRYLCRTRGSSHALYLQLLSQFSSPSSGSTRSPSVPSSAQDQGIVTFSARFISNTSITDRQAHSRPSLPIEGPEFWPLDLFLRVLRSTENRFDDDEMRVPTEAVDIAYRKIGFPGFVLSESFVLQVLSTYGNTKLPLSSYLAIFEWAGEQPGFHHTPETFNALNKILADLNPVLHEDLVKVLDFDHNRARFYNTLLVAYLIARLPDLASHILVPLLAERLNTPTSYNAVVDVLLQHKMFAEADAVLNSMYKDDQLSLELNNIIDTESLRQLVHSGNRVEARFRGGHALITLLSDHCENSRFKDAADLIDEFKELSSFNSYKPYEIWITSASKYAHSYFAAQNLSVHTQMAHQACNPDVVSYTSSLIGLVTGLRYKAASKLLMEMKKLQFMPCKPKASESMYHFLLNLLCGGGNESAGKAESDCCKEGDFDRLIQVLRISSRSCIGISLQLPESYRNFLYNKLISALCRAGRVEDAYLLYRDFNETYDRDASDYDVIRTTNEAYYHMINEFCRIRREDVADRLLFKMLNPWRKE